jgi:tetratricopeptide (TPR) repeat protein
LRGKPVIWKTLQSGLYLIPVIGGYLRDLAWEDLPVAEIRTNYLYGKAHAFDRAGLLEKAARVYHQIQKGQPEGIPVLMSLGGLYYRRGLYEVAASYYEKGVRLKPKHYQGHYWLAMCYWNTKRYYAAINTLEEVILYLPTFTDALNLMGECYERIGEASKAETCYLKAISVDPGGILLAKAAMEGGLVQSREEARIKH